MTNTPRWSHSRYGRMLAMSAAAPAQLARRVNAAMIDALVCLALVGLASVLPGGGGFAQTTRLAFVWLPILLLEPLLLRFTGSTVGQHLLSLRVVSLRGDALSFTRALVRYWTKLLLGFASLAYLMFSPRGQALHDRWFGTLVWHAQAGAAVPSPSSWTPPAPDPTLPPAWRRFAAFVLWSVAAQIGLGFTLAVGFALVSETERGASGAGAEFLVNAAVVVAELWLLHRAAHGRLWGARRGASAVSSGA
jgi:uncharacterized RDD family membrane protein YckC